MFKAYKLTLNNGKVNYLLAIERPVTVILVNGEHSMSGSAGCGIEECGIEELEAAWAREDEFRKAVKQSAEYGAIVGNNQGL